MRYIGTHCLIAALLLCCTIPCAAATVSGKVVPVSPDILVCLMSSKDGGEVARTWASEDGSFVLKSVKPGTYSFEVTADGYLTYKAPVTVTAKGPNRHLLKLTRGATLKGKVTPVISSVEIRLTSASDHYDLDYDPRTRVYTTGVGLPSGSYHLAARAQGYAPIDRDIKLSAPKTSVLDLKFVRGGSISGKIAPAPSQGAVIAVDIDGRRPITSAETKPDGSYKIENLPTGTYDLIILAKGYERVIGWGPVPGPDTLTDKDKRDIEGVFARGDKAWADKDVDTMMALIPDKTQTDAERRKFWTEMFSVVTSYSATRQIDFIVGQTGKSAVAVERMRRKLTAKDGTEERTSEQVAHVRVTLAFESGAWRMTDILTLPSRPEWNIPLNTRTEAFLVGAFPGEVADADKEKPVPWKYSGNPGILSIKVVSGAESKNHDYTLTPLAKP